MLNKLLKFLKQNMKELGGIKSSFSEGSQHICLAVNIVFELIKLCLRGELALLFNFYSGNLWL